MKNLPLSMLDSNELYTGSKRILLILISTLANNSYVVSLCSLLQKGISGMENAMGKALTSGFTSILMEKDTARDNAFIGLRDFINSYAHSKDAVKASAAILLSGIIQNIGNSIYRLGYVDETAKMNTLISALKSDEATQALQIIGATDWFLEMEAAQEEFEQAYKSKVEIESTINFPLLKDSKNTIGKSLKASLTYIESNTELEPETYIPIENKIDEVITDILTIARARITRVESEKKKKDSDGSVKS